MCPLKIQEKRDYNSLLLKLNGLPQFVANYIGYKLNEKMSPSSLLEYVRDFEVFFDWITIQKNNLYAPGDVTIELIQQLSVDDYQYIDYLSSERNLVERSISRKIHSLRSLFNYLHDDAQNDEGAPILIYNVFRKIKMHRVSDVQSNRKKY